MPIRPLKPEKGKVVQGRARKSSGVRRSRSGVSPAEAASSPSSPGRRCLGSLRQGERGEFSGWPERRNERQAEAGTAAKEEVDPAHWCTSPPASARTAYPVNRVNRSVRSAFCAPYSPSSSGQVLPASRVEIRDRRIGRESSEIRDYRPPDWGPSARVGELRKAIDS